MFVVESILDFKKKSKKVLVKWVGFPEATWENEDGIPKFIREYYEKDTGRLGKGLPNPKIKSTKQIGDSVREGFKKSKWKFKMAFAMKGGGSRGGLVCH